MELVVSRSVDEATFDEMARRLVEEYVATVDGRPVPSCSARPTPGCTSSGFAQRAWRALLAETRAAVLARPSRVPTRSA
jgi:hypothetical protein